MATRSRMLDEVLEIGRRELDYLAGGDVFEAEKLSRDRDRILDEALRGLSGGNLRKLADKIVAVKDLQDKLTTKARELHTTLRQDLTSLKRQNKRMAGYSFGSGNMPRLATQRFVNKKG